MRNAALASSISNQPIVESDLADGLDRITLTKIGQRFTALNKRRLDRLRAALLPQQQLFLDMLPVLFHLNHPSLPGYVGNVAPAGIENFRLSHLHIKSARKLSNSFALQREVNRSLEIAGLYFMGSCSSLTHHSHSDLDIWVAIRGQLSDEKRQALRQKCQLVSEWAASLRLEAHFFIMEEDTFKQRDRDAMSEEDCGTTQHYLLLDEFYRTSIVAAGCTPLWWYVPASQEDNYEQYAQTLLDKRYIQSSSVIDYGSPGVIPPQEFVTAGLWQLYKGISQPDKSLLKLLLLEVYASEYPNTQNLSQQFKAALYASEDDRDSFDPYLQVYRRIESYLQARAEDERLELLRRCLYIKANLQLSRVPGDDSPEQFIKTGGDRHWKWHLMYQLVREWGWRRDKLLELDNARNRRIHQVRAEQSALTRELTRSYQLIGKMLKTGHPTSGQLDTRTAETSQIELNLLGRQLYAAFEHKPNKLPQVTQSLVRSLSEERLIFRYNSGDNFDNHLDKNANNSAANSNAGSPALWTLAIDQTAGHDSTDDPIELKQSPDPVQLLVWAMINGLVDGNTRFKVVSDDVDIADIDLSDYELKQLAHSMRELLPMRNQIDGKPIDKRRFGKPAQTDHCLFIINAGIDPLKSHRLADIWRTSAKTDPLAYSAIAENLVASISVVTVNSWGEVYSHSYAGDTAINDALTHYFSQKQSDGRTALMPMRHFFCASSTKPIALVNRLATLYDDIASCINQEGEPVSAATASAAISNNSRTYLFESALGVHAFYWQNQQPMVVLYPDTQSLLETLAQRGDTGSLRIDHSALANHPLALVVRTLEARENTAKEPAPAIFYELVDKTAHIYLADHLGAIAYTEINFDSLRSLITPIQHFVIAHYRRNGEHYRQQSNNRARKGVEQPLHQLAHTSPLAEVSCYSLQQANGRYTAALLPNDGDLSASTFSIKASGMRDLQGELRWSIDCMGELFEEAVLGEQLYTAVAKTILAHRNPIQQHYRCYITDIEVDDAETPLSLTRDFNYKNQLEQKLNAACHKLVS